MTPEEIHMNSFSDIQLHYTHTLTHFHICTPHTMLNSFMLDWHQVKISEKRKLNWGSAFSTLDCRHARLTWGSLIICLFVDGWCSLWSVLHTGDRFFLYFMRKHNNKTMRYYPISNILPWRLLQFLPPVSCFEFLSYTSTLMKSDQRVVSWDKSFVSHSL